MHFGLYLKKKGVISAEQLVSAAEVQIASLTRIGQLALEESILSPRDIFEVLRAQSASPNQRFGDLAIELGYMTRDELMRLLMIQADRRRTIADILVCQGELTRQQVTDAMSEYRRSIAKRRAGSGVPVRIVPVARRFKVVSPVTA